MDVKGAKALADRIENGELILYAVTVKAKFWGRESVRRVLAHSADEAVEQVRAELGITFDVKEAG